MESKIKILREKIGDIPWVDLEDFILENQHIWRPVKGHCFETWFDKVLKKWGYQIESIGGDDVVDRIFKSKTLQLKTVYKNGTIEGKRIAVALHKTHGREKRPYNLYKTDSFADFLVLLHPSKGVVICPKEKIPLNGKYPRRQWPEYLADPAYFDWNTEWLNRFDLLGINKSYEDIPIFDDYKSNKIFKKIGKETQLTDEEVIDTLLAPENFRVLEQNIRGSIREWYFEQFASKKELALIPGSKSPTSYNL